MTKNELTRRYVVFTIGLFLSAFGVSMITRSFLGTSPISSTAFVLSLNTPISMGTYLMIMNALLILGQMALLGRRGVRENRVDLIMQVPVSLAFGAFVDAAMLMLRVLTPEAYWSQLLILLVGCFIMAAGIALQVIADVTMNSAEYFVRVVANRFKREFGTIKIGFDVTLVVLAVLTSLAMAHKIDGVREGTVIAALLTGPFVKMISPWLAFVRRWIETTVKPSAVQITTPAASAERPIVITVAREYGSGGHDLAALIAERLGIAFYDNQIIALAAADLGMTPEYITSNEQQMSSSLLLRMVTRDYEVSVDKSLSKDDAMFVAQSRVIRNLAAQGDCVIVGRCSDYVLRDMADCINLFVHASDDYKFSRAIREYGLTDENVKREVTRINKARAAHYQHYTQRRWDDLNNYDLTCDLSKVSPDTLVNMVISLYRDRRSSLR